MITTINNCSSGCRKNYCLPPIMLFFTLVIIATVLLSISDPLMIPANATSISTTTTTITISQGAALQETLQYYQPNSALAISGSQVTWINQDSTQHTATADDGSFDTGVVNPNSQGFATVQGQGEIPYHCEIHPFMTGTIRVSSSSSPPASSSSLPPRQPQDDGADSQGLTTRQQPITESPFEQSNNTTTGATTTTTTTTLNNTLLTSTLDYQTLRENYLAGWRMLDFDDRFHTFVEQNTVLGYGNFQEHQTGNTFSPGETMELYIEPVGFSHQSLTDDQGRELYGITMTTDIVISDSQGSVLQTIEDILAADIVSYAQVTEVYLVVDLIQEQPFPPGEYILTYIVTDENTGESFEIQEPIQIADTTDTAGSGFVFP